MTLIILVVLIFLEFVGLMVIGYFALHLALENQSLKVEVMNRPVFPAVEAVEQPETRSVTNFRYARQESLAKRRNRAIEQFLHECCEIGFTDDFVSSAHLYSVFCAWANKKGLSELIIGRNGFGYRVGTHGPYLRRKYVNGRQRRCVVGVRLKPDAYQLVTPG